MKVLSLIIYIFLSINLFSKIGSYTYFSEINDTNNNYKADKINLKIIKSIRNNITAHNFNVFTFYTYDVGYSINKDFLYIVEIIDNKNSNFYITTSDFDGENIASVLLLLKNEKNELVLCKIIRKIENSYSDLSETYFDFYKLIFDNVENRHKFLKVETIKSKMKYKNAKEAIKELK